MEAVLPILLVAQGVLAGVDTVLNHERLARLRKRPEARPELALHVGREAIWAGLLVALAWFAWHGAYAWLIAALLATEIAITAFDELVENRIRVAPTERARAAPFPCHQRRTDRGVGALLDWRAERAGAPRLRRAFLAHHGVRRDGRVLVGARLRRMAQPAAC